MDTQIEEIYTALAAWQFSVPYDNNGNTEVVTTPTLADMPRVPESMTLPLRILSPAINRAEAEKLVSNTLSWYGGGSIVWALEDLMLWRPVTQAFSPADVNLAMVRYMKLYQRAVNTYMAVIPSATIEDAAMAPGVYEYPIKSGNFYYACLCTLKIKELL